MSKPENKLFRCEVWNEEAGDGEGGLFVEFYWAEDVAEIESTFADSTGEKLYRAQECSPEVVAAWEAGYDEGVMVGIVGERIKSKEYLDSDGSVPFDLFEEVFKEQGEADGR